MSSDRNITATTFTTTTSTKSTINMVVTQVIVLIILIIIRARAFLCAVCIFSLHVSGLALGTLAS